VPQTIDEKRRCGSDAIVGAGANVGSDSGQMCPVDDLLVEAINVQAELERVATEVVVFQLMLTLE
jgi:hypothetical protein